jgi:membrane-bound lytic murein transglycosylase B
VDECKPLIWGIESSFGGFTGNMDSVQALATLGGVLHVQSPVESAWFQLESNL